MIFRTVLNQYQLLPKTVSFLALEMSKQNSGTVNTESIAVCYCSAVKWVRAVIMSLTEQQVNVSYPCYHPQHCSLYIFATSMYKLYFFLRQGLAMYHRLASISWPSLSTSQGLGLPRTFAPSPFFQSRVIKTYPKSLLALTSDFLILKEASLPFPC